jgi:hypothetical protein
MPICVVLCLQAVASQRDSDGSEFEPEQLPGMTKRRRLQQQQEQQQELDAQVGWHACSRLQACMYTC